MATTNFEALFDEASQFITQARSRLEAGEEVDLKGLDAVVAQLCDEVIRQPVAEAEVNKAKIQQLMQELNRVSDILTRQYDAIKAQLGGLNQQKQAHTAYATAGHLTRKSDDKKE